MRINGLRLAWLASAVAAGLVAVPSAPLAGAATADACQNWNGGLPANPATGTGAVNALLGAAAVSACDVWAVGYTSDTTGKASSRALIEHWAGGSWAVTPTPPLDTYTRLFSVSAVSASNVWAAGFTTDAASNRLQPLILHWNGSQWTRQASPGPAGADSESFGIAALSATDAWAVGQTGTGDSAAPLALHWDGTAWTQKTVPPQAGGGSYLRSVSGVSGSDAWALGLTAGNGTHPVLYRWNGSAWTPQAFPVPAAGQISGIAAVSANSVWAAGYVPGSSKDQTLVMHWDGSGWSQTEVPSPGGSNFDNALTGMASSSASDVWASGYYDQGSGQTVPFVLHFDGSSWTAANLPGSGGGDGNVIGAVAVSSTGQAWVAGASLSGSLTFASPVPVVPDVTGLSPDTASYTLRFYGLAGPSGALGHTTSCPGSSQGKIVASDPPAGLREPFGLPVNLTVCDTPANVMVPNVLSQDDTSARNAIVAAGLTVRSVTMEANCTVARNDVLRQSPDGGSTAPSGSGVSLVESTGRQPNGKLCVVN
jgi:hypothetical protein